jgi:hypothetical protein
MYFKVLEKFTHATLKQKIASAWIKWSQKSQNGFRHLNVNG